MSDDIGSVADTELARNKIFLTATHLKLFVEDTTYEFPRQYSGIRNSELLNHITTHDVAKYAILNDGQNPVQLRVLAANRALLEEERNKYERRQEYLREEELWCGWVNPEK